MSKEVTLESLAADFKVDLAKFRGQVNTQDGENKRRFNNLEIKIDNIERYLAEQKEVYPNLIRKSDLERATNFMAEIILDLLKHRIKQELAEFKEDLETEKNDKQGPWFVQDKLGRIKQVKSLFEKRIIEAQRKREYDKTQYQLKEFKL